MAEHLYLAFKSLTSVAIKKSDLGLKNFVNRLFNTISLSIMQFDKVNKQ